MGDLVQCFGLDLYVKGQGQLFGAEGTASEMFFDGIALCAFERAVEIARERRIVDVRLVRDSAQGLS